MKPHRLDELTYVEVAELVRAGADTAVLPVGTVEPHGPHLPLGTDTLIAEAIAELVAAKLNALLLPALPYGVTGSLHGYPGSVRVEPEAPEKLAYSVLESMALSGFKYALIVNGHGGNTPSLEAAARRAWYERRLATMVVDWWVLARERGVTQRVLGKEGGHATRHRRDSDRARREAAPREAGALLQQRSVRAQRRGPSLPPTRHRDQLHAPGGRRRLPTPGEVPAVPRGGR